VAPRDWRYDACLSEAVVMIGEKPENLANWMTGILKKKQIEVESRFDYERKGDEPNWPTEDAPPNTTNGSFL